jgi:PLP dependent protein
MKRKLYVLDQEIPKNIEIVYVTKYATLAQMGELIAAGRLVLGENKVQDLVRKAEFFLKEKISWHFIGHLQTNKVKKIINLVTYIQSVDSLRLLEKIDDEAGKIGKKVKVLLQVNMAEEESKFGFSKEDIRGNPKLFSFKNIVIAGLMTIGPNVKNEEKIRVCFRETKKLFDEVRHKYGGIETLSMGMSSDYKMAIEEGSNMIRLGRIVLEN